ncbi:MAG TPA: inorganic diphosphatase [Terriglobales bacterium]|nr:inorganic diphosphatase [Terriglobales bacterium]
MFIPGHGATAGRGAPEFKLKLLTYLFCKTFILQFFAGEADFVPATKSADGDPLDVLVLMDEPTFPGCMLDCMLIGVIEAEQEEQGTMVRNDRLIAVATQSLRYAEVKHIRDLNETILKQIEAFFVNYQKLRNVELRILGRRGPEGALEILRKAAEQKHAA